jgi:lipopolysaccharide transport system ATP-binding protein
VGTGFHPELTGRENIFLNGAILGMTRRDIQRHFDEIVDFAEVEQFLDTPVKRYSSGMYMRLAFAVAAHLEPEVLVVDEVLAVGDAKFQEKCLDKMGAVAHSGRTVLFVSHNMSAVQQLCTRGIWLTSGTIQQQGSASTVVSAYLDDARQFSTAQFVDLRNHPARVPGSSPILESMRISQKQVDGTLCLTLDLVLNPVHRLDAPAIGFTVETIAGQRVFSVTNHFSGIVIPSIAGPTTVTCEMPNVPLYSSTYLLNVAVGTTADNMIDSFYKILSFMVPPTGDEAEVKLNPLQHGPVRVFARWHTRNDHIN